MAKTGTASLTIAELREFASFSESEQLFIERSLDIAMGRGDAFKTWGEGGDGASIRGQYLAYRELKTLRETVPCEATMDGLEAFMGPLMRVTALDLAQEKLESFSAYRFLYERLLGAKSRPWLPAAFCAAAALPQISAGAAQDAAPVAERGRGHCAGMVGPRAAVLSRTRRSRGGLTATLCRAHRAGTDTSRGSAPA